MKSSNNKKSNKSKQKEDNNETSEFLSLVSRGKNPEVSPAAKEVFQRTVNLYWQELTVSPVEEKNKQDVSSTSKDDDDNNDAGLCSSSSSSEDDEVTLDEACSRNPLDNHDDYDSGIDLEVYDKVQDSWDFDDVEVSEDIALGNVEAFKNDYVRKLKLQGGLHVHYSAVIQSMLEEDRMESKIFFLFITKSFFDAVRKWTLANMRLSTTSRRLPRKGLSESLFYAYIGLELGMSFCQYNQIKDYWANSIFTGHQTFK